MLTQIPTWHSAPKFSHKGYIYKPEVDEDDDGVRKVWHECVNRVDATDTLVSNCDPYRFMTEQEFKDFINLMARVRA